MNYYKRHIGDYMKDASHLSLLEHGVYMRLIDVYYTRESSIPEDQAARLIGARTKEEKEALSVVLSEFFTCSNGEYFQKRCDAEIDKMLMKTETNRVIGRLGGRPKKETQTVSENNPDGLQTETQTVSENNPSARASTSHKPLTNTNNKHGQQDSTVQERVSTPQGEICKALRDAGLLQVNPSHPTLLALIDAGATKDDFIGALSTAKKKDFGYLLGMVKGQFEDAAQLSIQKKPEKQKADFIRPDGSFDIDAFNRWSPEART